MHSLDFSCSAAVRAIDVRSALTGDVGAALESLSAEANLARMVDAYASTSLLGEVSRAWIERSAAHAELFACVPPQRRSRAIRK